MAEPSSERAPAPPSLKDADWLKRPQVVRVFQALSKDGVATRAVGGAVRNSLLGLPVTDIDLATTALPQRIMALARTADLKAVPTGIEHGTVTVVADGTPFEVTTLRRDVETFGRHATVAFTEDWEEDARRRDFTLNALYADRDGTVFDPLGGYADLVAGRVRFIERDAESNGGEAEIAPGVRVHHVGGHTAGMQIVSVRTARGTAVLTSDASHYYANYEQDRPFNTLHDLPGTYRAFARIRALASAPDLIVPGHDPLVLERLQPVVDGIVMLA